MSQRRVTFNDWCLGNVVRHGPDPYDATYVCPVCGNVATTRESVQAGIMHSLTGRACLKGCEITEYPVVVVFPSGREIGVFESAPLEEN